VAAVTISAVGDIELGNTPELPADPGDYLALVEAALQAPIVFGNLEGTLTTLATSPKCVRPTPTPSPSASATASAGASASASATASASPSSATPTASPPPPCFAFHVPPSYARVMRGAGFTVLNSANNHSHDFGARGVADTSSALRAAGIVQTGLPGQIAVVDDAGTRVAFVGFAPYSLTSNMLDVARARALIEKARSEADIVVVYMHAGAEGTAAAHVDSHEEYYAGEDRGNAKAFAHAAIDAGAALVIGSGPHVLRGIEEYHGHLIAYSLGDFAGYHAFSTAGSLALSGILRVELTRSGDFVAGHFTSLVLDAGDRPAPDPSGAAASFVNRLSLADFDTSAVSIGTHGELELPAR
jgi:hypothetical protein